MIAERLSGRPTILLVGAVRGLADEVEPVRAQLDSFDPGAVAVSLSPEEAETLAQYFVGTPTEPVVPLSASEASHAVGLARISEVQVPAPALLGAVDWAARRERPVLGVDPPEDVYAEMFAAHIGYFELVRRTLRERTLVKRPPEVETADDYALSWDRTMRPGDGSERLARARDEYAAGKVRELGRAHPKIALVVDRERYDSFRSALRSGP
ncbi:MAG: hypothetical protein L3K14_03950 [Thermoplasmata archaeon]|nr:hypothetical protein [Thermoplasmata archaeon]